MRPPRQIEEHAGGALQTLASPFHRGDRIVEIRHGRMITDRIHLPPVLPQRRLESRREMLRRDLREGRPAAKGVSHCARSGFPDGLAAADVTGAISLERVSCIRCKASLAADKG